MLGMIWGGIRGSYIRDRANVRHRDGDWGAPCTQHREHQLSHLYNDFVWADMAKSHNIVLFCIFICKLCQNSESETLNCDDLKVPFQVVSVAVFYIWWNGPLLSVMHCFRRARQGKAGFPWQRSPPWIAPPPPSCASTRHRCSALEGRYQQCCQ